MKNIFFTLIVAICFGTQLMATEPVISNMCCPVVVSTVEVDFAYNEAIYSKYFSPAYFNQETNSLHFEANQNINFIKIINAEGVLEFRLPVMSNKVRINKNMFVKGEYKLEFEINDSSEDLFTYVRIN